MKKLNKNSIATAIVLAASLVLGLTGPIAAFAAGPATVDLLSVSTNNFVILSKTGITDVPKSIITGNIGTSPITGAAIGVTCAEVTGIIYSVNAAGPLPCRVTNARLLTAAVRDMQTAYTNAAGRTNPTATELGAGNIGGMTLAPGLYKWSTGLTIPTDVTLSGGANDVWIFQVAQTLNISSATKVVLAGGAQAKNIFWVVAGQTTIGTTAVFNGNILDQTAIVLNTGAKLNGRALAQTAVTLDSNAVIAPTSAASTPESPAVPATSAAPTSKTTVPATSTTAADPATATTHATPDRATTIATTATATNTTDTGCLPGNKFSTTTGRDCGSTVTTPPYVDPLVKSIAINLGTGSSGNEVKILQQFLMSQNKGPDAQALAKAGDTAYFGVLTRAALAEFQAKAGISPALGNFGPITRAYLRVNLP
jgi:hypothetical protein